jgi:hypothetical protein
MPARAAASRLFEARLADMQWLRPEILAVEFEQVEGVQDHALIVPPAVQVLEDREAVGIATDRLAVDRDRGGPERRHGLSDERIALGPVVAPPCEQADPVAMLPRDQPIAVVLDLVHPVRLWEAARPGSGCRAR